MRGFTRIGKSAPLLFLGVCAVVAVAGIAVGSSLDLTPAPAAASTIHEVARTDTPNPGASAYAEHRYRIVGKLRLAGIWTKHDDIGSARMTCCSAVRNPASAPSGRVVCLPCHCGARAMRSSNRSNIRYVTPAAETVVLAPVTSVFPIDEQDAPNSGPSDAM